MSLEREPFSSQDRLAAFGLSENERLLYRITDKRLRKIVADEQTTIHKISLDANNYGEFLFVTVSREVADKPVIITFYGLGHHEYREQWFTDEWYWYQGNPFSTILQSTLSKPEAEKQIQARCDEIVAYVTDHTPSQAAQLFAMLADLTDEDGAYTEMEDMGGFADFGLFVDGEEE
jgi:hypothetical protein